MKPLVERGIPQRRPTGADILESLLAGWLSGALGSIRVPIICAIFAIENLLPLVVSAAMRLNQVISTIVNQTEPKFL